MDKTDLRIVKTNKALYEALLLLMKEKTFEEIKISDLCQKALINRSTFYAHYNDKYELLITMVEDLKQALLSSLKTNENDINTANISVLYSNLKDFQKRTDDIKNVIEKNIGSSVVVSYNSSLIDYEGGVSDTTMASLYSVGAVVIVIIILSSVFVIRNSFSLI